MKSMRFGMGKLRNLAGEGKRDLAKAEVTPEQRRDGGERVQATREESVWVYRVPASEAA